MTFNIKQIATSKAHSCTIERYTHTSPTLNNLQASFTLIVPQSPTKPPLLYWLSGLTCTDQNFPTKAAAPLHCKTHNVAIVCPDTSPRGANIPGEDDAWDFGTGAAFYVDATQPPYNSSYNMYSYFAKELPQLLEAHFAPRISVSVCSIFGHSMGGMGALSLAIRNEHSYASVSAFSPISNPSDVPWGHKCFTGYLGDDRASWAQYDPTELIKSRGRPLYDADILIEQGGADEFITFLKPDTFVDACRQVGQKVVINMAEGYDHSYYFIQTFLGKHIAFHASILHHKLGSVE